MSPEISKEAAIISPLAFIAPLISMVVAAICISVSATRSSCPSALEFMYIALSRNCIFWSVVVVFPLAKTSVNVSEVATWLSTYVLIDCCVASLVALLDAILSSSSMSVIVTEPVPDKLLNSTAAKSVLPATVKVLSTNKSGMDMFCVISYTIALEPPPSVAITFSLPAAIATFAPEP